MIDITSEKLIRLGEVPKLPWVPKGRLGADTICKATPHRWATVGVRSIVLETVSVGGARCTTEAALLRFFERLATRGSTSTTETPTQRRKAVSRAEAILAKDGL